MQHQTNSFSKILLYAIALLGAIALLFIYFKFSPEEGYFPKCPFKSVTGYDCPGCGSQRAIHEILHFNIGKAFRFNPLLVVSIPYIFLGILFNFNSIKQRFPKTRNFLFGSKAIYFILIAVILFFILRNIL